MIFLTRGISTEVRPQSAHNTLKSQASSIGLSQSIVCTMRDGLCLKCFYQFPTSLFIKKDHSYSNDQCGQAKRLIE